MNQASRSLPIPGLRWGSYPQRNDTDDVRRRSSDNALLAGAAALFAPLTALTGGAAARLGIRRQPTVRDRLGLVGPASEVRRPSPRDWQGRVTRIQARARHWQSMDLRAFARMRAVIQARIALEGLTPAATDAAAAFVVEAARRALGRSAYDGQVKAAIAMTDNRLVEMATGEGKSLATALAAAIAALAGIPVHVLTANDYLVSRDAETFEPLFSALALTVATVIGTTSAPQRRLAYRSDIVYATAREVAFDYLRDRMSHPGRSVDASLVDRLLQADDPQAGPMMRGLCMAIIDEADSILIDEAQMPLVLSREVRDPTLQGALYQAWLLAGRLDAGTDFTVRTAERTVLLEPAGRERLEQLAAPLSAAWKNALHREQLVLAALTARHALARDRDYLITRSERDGKPQVELLDGVTGRIATGRRWSGGIHAMVAIKERITPEADLETIDQITFQRFFRRYHRLGGSSGTLAESRRELRRVYGLSITKVAPRLPLQRRQRPTRWFRDDAARDQALVGRVRELTQRQRPVLIGTDSVADTRRISACLSAAGIAHAVLDARFDADEAALVARAGEAAMVTVSTNMAGRGTDIVLTPAARKAGGLHVLMCQHNTSRRHDRQLAGRAGRQGDPGSFEAWLSLDDRRYADRGARHRAAPLLERFLGGAEVRLPPAVLGTVQRTTQRTEEFQLERRRARMLRDDHALQLSLGFAGPG